MPETAITSARALLQRIDNATDGQHIPVANTVLLQIGKRYARQEGKNVVIEVPEACWNTLPVRFTTPRRFRSRTKKPAKTQRINQ